jgi:hypothetical protein
MRLFKYLHPDRTDVLRGGLIRFSSPRVLNDPFELRPHVLGLVRKEQIPTDISRGIPEAIAISYSELPAEVRTLIPRDLYQAFAQAFLKPQMPHLPAFVEAIFETMLPKVKEVMFQKFDELIGILCLTESPTNLLMWAHYADAHQGLVIEFDPSSSFFDQRLGPEDDLRHLRKVVYQEERPAVVLTEINDFTPFLTKGMDWNYESEWRMMVPISGATRVIGDGTNAVHLFGFPRAMVKSVICGCRMRDTKKAEIQEILAATPEYKNVQCMAARIDEARYRILIEAGGGAPHAFQVAS